MRHNGSHRHVQSESTKGSNGAAGNRAHANGGLVAACLGFRLMFVQLLIDYIAETADPAAIALFRDRCRVFELPTGTFVNLAEFLSDSIERPWAKQPASCRSNVVENAHNIRVDVLLPAPSPCGDVRPHSHLMTFFKICAAQGRRWLDAHSQASVDEVQCHLLQIYNEQAEFLLNHVLGDAVRAQEGPRSEYRCPLTDPEVRLYFPVSIEGKQRGFRLKAALEEEGHVS